MSRQLMSKTSAVSSIHRKRAPSAKSSGPAAAGRGPDDPGAREAAADDASPAGNREAGDDHGRAQVAAASGGGNRVAAPSLTRVLGANLHRLRSSRGLSLERLSRASGVSRAMLNQIELGRSTPTINVLWKIARALGVPFSSLITSTSESGLTLLRASTSKVLASHDGSFLSRALFPVDAPRSVEFYELRLAPRSVEKAEPHAPGTQENLVVAEGALAMLIGGGRHLLGPGDAIVFDADVPHEYRNEAAEPLRMFLVMTYESQGPVR